MKRFASLGLFAVLAVACQMKTSDLSSKKKEADSPDSLPRIAQEVNALKKESGILGCVGVDSKFNMVRTRATFSSGKLESMTIEAFANKANPSQVPNELTPNLKDYQVFSHELTSKMLDLDMDLDGKKYSIEVVTAMNGKSRKIFDLDMSIGPDGEGDLLLNGYLSYKDTSIGFDLSELYMGCYVLPKK